MSGDPDQLSYADVLVRIGELAEALTRSPDKEVAEPVGELLDWVDAFHRDGIGRLVEMIREWRGEIFLEAVARDELAGTLLGAYGLGEGTGTGDQAADAVDAAIDDVRPMIESHGGSIEVEDVTDGVVKVRLSGTCDGCPSSSATLTYGVQTALVEHWPNFRRLEVVDPAAEADPAKAGLTCGIPSTIPDTLATTGSQAPASQSGAPQSVMVQIRGHEGK